MYMYILYKYISIYVYMSKCGMMHAKCSLVGFAPCTNLSCISYNFLFRVAEFVEHFSIERGYT